MMKGKAEERDTVSYIYIFIINDKRTNTHHQKEKKEHTLTLNSQCSMLNDKKCGMIISYGTRYDMYSTRYVRYCMHSWPQQELPPCTYCTK